MMMWKTKFEGSVFLAFPSLSESLWFGATFPIFKFRLLDDLHTSSYQARLHFWSLLPSIPPYYGHLWTIFFHHIPSISIIHQALGSEASDIYVGEEGKDLVSQSLQGKSEVRGVKKTPGCRWSNAFGMVIWYDMAKIKRTNEKLQHVHHVENWDRPRRFEDVHFFSDPLFFQAGEEAWKMKFAIRQEPKFYSLFGRFLAPSNHLTMNDGKSW